MKLIKDKIVVELTDQFVIDIYKDSGWEELIEAPKKVDKAEKTELTEKDQSKKK